MTKPSESIKYELRPRALAEIIDALADFPDDYEQLPVVPPDELARVTASVLDRLGLTEESSVGDREETVVEATIGDEVETWLAAQLETVSRTQVAEAIPCPTITLSVPLLEDFGYESVVEIDADFDAPAHRTRMVVIIRREAEDAVPLVLTVRAADGSIHTEAHDEDGFARLDSIPTEHPQDLKFLWQRAQ